MNKTFKETFIEKIIAAKTMDEFIEIEHEIIHHYRHAVDYKNSLSNQIFKYCESMSMLIRKEASELTDERNELLTIVSRKRRSLKKEGDAN